MAVRGAGYRVIESRANLGNGRGRIRRLSVLTPEGRRLNALAYKYLTADDVRAMNRYSLTGYVAAMLLESALQACGRNLTRACVVQKLEQTKNFASDGIMAPLTFGPGIRQSGTRPILLKANVAAGKFERASDWLTDK